MNKKGFDFEEFKNIFFMVLFIISLFGAVTYERENNQLKSDNQLLWSSVDRLSEDLRTCQNLNLPKCSDPIPLKDGTYLCNLDDLE